MNLTPEQRVERARLGGLTVRSRTSGIRLIAPALEGLRAKWEREALADAAAQGETLSGAELVARANARAQLHYARMRWAKAQKARARAAQANAQ